MALKSMLILFAALCIIPQINAGLFKKLMNKNVATTIERFEQCKENPNTDILFTELKITQANATLFFVNGKMTFQTVIENKWSITFNIKRCKDRDNLSSCSRFFEMTTPNCCEAVQSKGQIWTSFVDHIKLTEKCPIHPGTYMLKDYEANADMIRFLPMDESFFLIKVTSQANGKLVLCVDIQIYTTKI